MADENLSAQPGLPQIQEAFALIDRDMRAVEVWAKALRDLTREVPAASAASRKKPAPRGAKVRKRSPTPRRAA